jgi:phosphoribosylglycinamide formyltransferase-1
MTPESPIGAVVSENDVAVPDTPKPLLLGILISGRGSNMKAIHSAIQRGDINARIAAVISDNPQADGVVWARSEGLAVYTISRNDFDKKSDFEACIVEKLGIHMVDWVVLAGYMRLVGKTLLGAYQNRMVNIHPSLLPAFPGLHAQAQALAYGVKVAGCTVHLVDKTMDGGPIIAQEAVPVLPDDTVDSLSQRILAVEHQLFPTVLKVIAQNHGV